MTSLPSDRGCWQSWDRRVHPMAGRGPGGSSLALLPNRGRVQRPRPRPPRTWKLELEEPVTSVLQGWTSQTPGQWQPQPFSAPSWRPCRARVCECLPGPQGPSLLCRGGHCHLCLPAAPRPSPLGPVLSSAGNILPGSGTTPLLKLQAQSGSRATSALPFPSGRVGSRGHPTLPPANSRLQQ